MKKVKYLLLVVAMYLISPLSAYAIQFESGDTKYVLNEVDFGCDLIDDTKEFLGYDNDLGVYVFKDENTVIGNFLNSLNNTVDVYNDNNIFYKVNETVCDKMSVSEVLNFYQNSSRHFFELFDYDIYEVKDRLNYAFVKSDGIYHNDVDYFTVDLTTYNSLEVIDDYNYVNVSQGDDVSNYYEFKHFKRPSKAEIVVGVTYYTIQFTNYDSLAKEVINPDVNDILNYYVISDENEDNVFVTSLNENVFEKIYDTHKNSYPVVYYDYDLETGFVGFVDELDDNNVAYTSYDLNGNKISDKYVINGIFSNSLLQGYSRDATVFLNMNGEEVFKKDNFLFEFNEASYNNYVLNLYGYDISKGLAFYKLYEYKLLSDDNRIVDKSKDFDIKFSGLLEKVKKGSVEVNGKALDDKYYELSSGSTIVTLKKDYLNTLKDGEYTLSIKYIDEGKDDIKLESTFKVGDSVVAPPNTFDGVDMSIVFGIISLIGFGGVVIKMKKKNKIRV